MEPTVQDLVNAIMMDASLSQPQKSDLIYKLKTQVQQVGASPTTMVKHIGVAGGVIGFLLSKYFHLGLAGQAVATAAGYGIGNVVSPLINYQLNQQYLDQNSIMNRATRALMPAFLGSRSTY